MDSRQELGVNSIQEKVRENEMRPRWYGHMQRMEENNEVRAVGDMKVPGKRPRGNHAWIASEGICRHLARKVEEQEEGSGLKGGKTEETFQM